MAKSSSFSQCDLNITLPEDITICEPSIVDIQAIVSPLPDAVSWIGPDGFTSNDLAISPFVDENSTYTFQAFIATENNLVTNGDFESGDTGFSSGYLLGDIFCPFPQGPLWCEGMYTIDDNPNDSHPNFASCDDHTTGNGNMLIANGSSSFTDVWCQNITVTPNTNYLFSAWATSVVAESPAILQFTINGSTIGNNFNVNSTTCSWQNFTASWNSGAQTSAEICIQNQNVASSGNDFAVDDIEFLEVCEQEETVNIVLANVLGTLQTSYSINCTNPFAELNIQPPVNNYLYEWGTQFGGTIAGPTNEATATATTAGLYTITITDETGCTKTLTTSVNGSTAAPTSSIEGDFQIDCDENSVNVFSTNSNQNLIFEWENNSSTSTLAEYSEAGNYTLTITNQFDCTTEIDFTITSVDAEIDYNFQVQDTLSCIGDTTSISFFSLENTSIEWFNQNGNSLGTEETLIVDDVGNYILQITLENGCTTTDTAVVVSEISTLDYLLGESPLITCNLSQAPIEVSINSNFSEVNWFNDTFIGSGTSIIVDSAGIYTLEITDLNGCITRDSVFVFDNFDSPIFDTFSEEIDCTSGMGFLSIISDSSYLVEWELPDGTTLFGDSITSGLQGNHLVTVTNSLGCELMDTIELQANQEFPNIEIDIEQINCSNMEGKINSSSNIDNTSIFWVGPNGFTSQEANISIAEVGTYIYEAISPLGCTVIDTVFIQGDFISPDIQLSPTDTLDCNTEDIAILVSSNSNFTINNVSSNTIFNVIDSLILVNSEGKLIVEIKGENGCSSIDSIEIPTNHSTPSLENIDDFTLTCLKPDTLLIASSTDSFDYQWYWVEEFEFEHTTEYFISEEGSFILRKIDKENGCESFTNFSVSVDQDAEIPNINNSKINCLDDFSLISISSAQEIISIESSSDVNNTGTLTFETFTSGLKEFTVTYSNGCTTEISTEIEIDTIPPALNSTDYTFACMKEPLAVVVDYVIDDPSFQWEGPDGFTSTEEVIFTAIAGLYTVTVTDETNGCQAIEEINVFNNTTKIETELDLTQPQCFGDLGVINYIKTEGGTEPYTIQLIDENNSEVDDYFIPTGTYTIYIEDLLGCDTSFNFSVDPTFPFAVEAGKDTVIIKGESIQLNASTDLLDANLTNIEWFPAELLSCNNCFSPNVEELNEDTWFKIEVTDNNECIETDSILVRVLIDYSIYVPNIFTPDEDGQNDEFGIFSSVAGEDINIIEFNIYDRWGNKVYEAKDFNPNNLSISWDGRHNGKPVSQGVYAYVFKAKFPEGKEEIFKGTVTLMR